MNFDEKIMVRCDRKLKKFLEQEAKLLRKETQFGKIGAGTVMRIWADERMRSEQAKRR